MKIINFLASLYEFRSGCWFYRTQMPCTALIKRGHEIKNLVIGPNFEISSLELSSIPDIAIFRGTYPFDPTSIMKKLKKIDTKVVYNVDDDYLTLNAGNPVQKESKKVMHQYIACVKTADVVIVSTEVLKKRLLKYNKNVQLAPNGLGFDRFRNRDGNNKKLRIGYTGASSHWEDLGLILDVLNDLQAKYPFDFFLQGMCGTPLIGEIYTYKYILRENIEPEKRGYYTSALNMYEKLKRMEFIHIPFYPPELYPEILRNLNLDIGVAPLKDNTFNQAKSCNKFYEYASTGTPTLASKVLPYSKEVGYCAKNTYRDWYNKLEKLIRNKKFRESLLKKQQKFVKKHANIDEVIKVWERIYMEK